MALKDQIKTLLQEADLYRNQGLLNEAKAKYESAAGVIKKNEQIKNRESLLTAIQKKIAGLEADRTRVEKGPSSPQLSSKAQDLIQKLFSFSDDNDAEAKALDGAVALAKFGQFERALAELQNLLKSAQHRVEAAKNIINCHLNMADTDQAIAQYKDWLAGDLFDSDQLERLRTFLEDNLRKHGVQKSLPKAKTVEETKDLGKTTDEEFIDISSIGITFDSGPSKGNMVEFDVNFQSGNIISLIIPTKDKALIENLNTGYKLNDIQFYSPIAIFKGTGIVSSKTQIKSGPKQGDFCLDIKITST